MNRTALTVTSIASLAIIAAAAMISARVVAGPLDPPSGAVSPTYKTLSEVEPRIAINATNTPGDANSVFRIAQPGSYYLTGNLTGQAAKHGIEIAASGVNLDLNGFDLVGVTSSLDGIATSVSSLRNITIRNGSVRNWGDDGVDLYSTFTKVARVEGVHSTGNVGYGIRLGDGGLVSDCHASYNGVSGISGALTVVACVARNNTQYGISIVNGGTITDSSAFSNTLYGIYAGNGCTITHCSARSNGDGMIAFGESLVQGCTAVGNTGDGINGQQGTTILDCVCSENGADGIVVLNMSLVRGNTCTNNLSDGIFVSSFDGNRIEGNHMSGNARGLHVIGAGNVIVRNTANANTAVNWSIVANNVVGPILNRTAPASPAISGDSAASSLGSTDANANYTY